MAEYDEIPIFLTKTQNLIDDDRTMYEFMAALDDNVMIFFCNKFIDTKILIVYDPD